LALLARYSAETQAEQKARWDVEDALSNFQKHLKEMEGDLPEPFIIKYDFKHSENCRVCDKPTKPGIGTQHLRFCSDFCYLRARRNPKFEYYQDAAGIAKSIAAFNKHLAEQELILQAEHDKVNRVEDEKLKILRQREQERIERIERQKRLDLQREEDRLRRESERAEREAAQRAKDDEKAKKLADEEAANQAEEKKWLPKIFRW
jgi:hypothetical protein